MHGLVWMAVWLAVLVPGMFGASGSARADDVLVFAAASLKESLDDVVRRYQAANADRILISYAASSTLAKQIEGGAPADIFISADLEWMDYLAARAAIKPTTRVNLVGNDLVLIAPANSMFALKLGPGVDLASVLKGGRLAMADPDHVPAGKYGKAALEALGVWTSVQGSIAPAENVRAALAYVARGEAPLGIVYRTDATAEKLVRVVDAFPQGTYPRIVYPAAQTSGSGKGAAARFLTYLRSADAKTVFRRFGFIPAE